MDQETLRLIVTAGVALVAGLGGAGLSSWINRKNTVETLTASNDRDHATWLRGQKQEAYANFLAKAESIIHQTGANPDAPLPMPPLEEMAVLRGRLRLVGAPDAIQLAVKIDWEVRVAVLLRLQKDQNVDGELIKTLDFMDMHSRAMGRFHALAEEFVIHVRTELGTGTAVKEEVPYTDPEPINVTLDLKTLGVDVDNLTAALDGLGRNPKAH